MQTKSLIRKFNGRLQDLVETQRSVRPQGFRPAGDIPGNHRGLGTEFPRDQIELIGSCPRRRIAAEIENFRRTPGEVQQQEADTPNAAHIRFHHPQGDCGGDRRIDRVASLSQDIHSHLGGEGMSTGHGGSPSHDGGAGSGP